MRSVMDRIHKTCCEKKGAPRFEDARKFSNRLKWIIYMLQYFCAKDEFKLAVLERQRLNVPNNFRISSGVDVHSKSIRKKFIIPRASSPNIENPFIRAVYR